MSPATRIRYFSLWAAACRCQKWPAKDEAFRRSVTRQVMEAVRAPVTDSITALDDDQISALFRFLEHKADDADLIKAARWVDCIKDYRTANRARQADYHERALYGSNKRKPNKLDRDRFAGERSALGQPLADLDPEEVRKRHITFASRHQKKQREERAQADKFAAQIRADAPAELVPFEPDLDHSTAVDLSPEDALTD
jgi:hypothetical protein